MITGLDGNKPREPHADRFGRDQRHPLQDDASLLQALDALPARTLRQADAMRNLRQRTAGILLQEHHDLPVDRIHDPITREKLPARRYTQGTATALSGLVRGISTESS